MQGKWDAFAFTRTVTTANPDPNLNGAMSARRIQGEATTHKGITL